MPTELLRRDAVRVVERLLQLVVGLAVVRLPLPDEPPRPVVVRDVEPLLELGAERFAAQFQLLVVVRVGARLLQLLRPPVIAQLAVRSRPAVEQ